MARNQNRIVLSPGASWADRRRPRSDFGEGNCPLAGRPAGRWLRGFEHWAWGGYKLNQINGEVVSMGWVIFGVSLVFPISAIWTKRGIIVIGIPFGLPSARGEFQPERAR